MLYRYSVRTQFALFDLSAFASHINVKQLNGYESCLNCKIRGTLIGKEVFYPYTSISYESKTVDDYLKFGSGNYSHSTYIGTLGQMPLTDIIILPSMIPKDYIHLVAGGHMKWLMGR